MSNKKTSFKELSNILGEQLGKVTEKVSDSVQNFDKEGFSENANQLGKKIISAAGDAGNAAYKSVQEKYDKAVGEDKYCICCGKKLGIIGTKRKLADGTLCSDCSQKFSDVVEEENLSLPTLTYSELVDHFEVYEENRKIREKKQRKTTLILAGIAFLFCIGALFTISSKPKSESHADQVQMPGNVSYFTGKNYQDVVKELGQLGFSNITSTQLEEDPGKGKENGEVIDVKIDGFTDFKESDWVDKGSEVIVLYHVDKQVEETTNVPQTVSTTQEKSNEKPENVFYSTNDLETAKQGNTGVFAYNKTGPNYDQYYIIDFDEGYVYSFMEGDGNSTCDRLKIESGDLNDVLIVTYHDGGDTWSNGLHFKNKNMPDTLIVEDQDHNTYKYIHTFLDEALELRSKKTIIDY